MPHPITVQTTINAPLETVWMAWTTPEHVQQWNAASEDWHCPSGTNDLRVGGEFHYQMAAKDGSASFDFGGTYTIVEPQSRIEYTLGDGRHVVVTFEPTDAGVHLTEQFDPETENPEEMQRAGWQAILNRFTTYVEGLR